jgi:hypothetical protein
MHDPRCAEFDAWLDAMPSAWQQAVTMRALSMAFAKVHACPEWRERIVVLEDAMHLRPEEQERLVMEAMAVARTLASRSRRAA